MFCVDCATLHCISVQVDFHNLSETENNALIFGTYRYMARRTKGIETRKGKAGMFLDQRRSIRTNLAPQLAAFILVTDDDALVTQFSFGLTLSFALVRQLFGARVGHEKASRRRRSSGVRPDCCVLMMPVNWAPLGRLLETTRHSFFKRFRSRPGSSHDHPSKRVLARCGSSTSFRRGLRSACIPCFYLRFAARVCTRNVVCRSRRQFLCRSLADAIPVQLGAYRHILRDSPP